MDGVGGAYRRRCDDATITRTPPPKTGDGPEPRHGPRPRRLATRAAANRALALRRGREPLPPHREALLAITGRLIVHLENASNSLYYAGETTPEGEPRVLLQRVLDLTREVRELLRAVFLDESDPLSLIGDR